MSKPPIGIYVHVPFCTEKCPYCDFYSLTQQFGKLDAYTEAVVQTLRTYARQGHQADTLYFGGGTPSLLGAARIGQIIQAVRELFAFPANGEITVEVNPTAQERWLERLFYGLACQGVNRVSIGLQSAHTHELKQLGRRHTPEQGSKAVQLARAAGMENISLDLMLATPGQTWESLLHSLEFCCALEVPHLSAYLLKIEPGTAFAKNQERLQPLLPTEEQVELLYLWMVAELKRRGWEQYEISNFARREPGQLWESRHNKKYWRGEEYLGVGPAAHSFLNGERFYFPANLDRFLAGCEPVPDGQGGSPEEFVMLRLRLCEGLSEGVWQQRFGGPLPEAYLRRAKKFVSPGLVQFYASEPGFFLTPKGFLVSNAVIGEILFGG